MTLETTQVKWLSDGDGAWLCLKAPLRDVMHAAEALKDPKGYTADIRRKRKRRSLDSNAYCWTLIGRIAAKVGAPPEEAADPDSWGIAVLGPRTNVAERETVPPKTMLDRTHGKEAAQ